MSEMELYVDAERNELLVKVKGSLGKDFRVQIPENLKGKEVISAKFSKNKHRLVVRFEPELVFNTYGSTDGSVQENDQYFESRREVTRNIADEKNKSGDSETQLMNAAKEAQRLKDEGNKLVRDGRSIHFDKTRN
jgi:hypothetical protein